MTYRTRGPRTSTPPAPRPNKYGGKCVLCQNWIGEGEGLAAKVGEKWVVQHSPLTGCPAPKPVANAEPGYYSHDGKIVVVVQSKRNADRTYAKVLTGSLTEAGRTRWSWEYAPGVGMSVAHLTPVSLADACAWGVAHGTCMVCCRALTDPASVERGIGPVCAKRFR